MPPAYRKEAARFLVSLFNIRDSFIFDSDIGKFYNTQMRPTENNEQHVMDLRRRQKITEAETMNLLHLTRWELMDKMGEYKIPMSRVTLEELREELYKSRPLVFARNRSCNNNG